MAFKIKQKPEDFVVREVIHDELSESWKEKMRRIRGIPPKSEGGEKYLWFTMKKSDRDFFRTIEALGKSLRISTKDIGYAGTKDKSAITYQTVSVPIEKEEDVRKICMRGVEISDLRHRNRRIKLGEHEGNEFEITVRSIGKGDRKKIEKRLAEIRERGMVNYFGDQRFGSVESSNDRVGKMIVLGDLKGAVDILTKGEPREGTVESRIKEHLERKPEDHAGALMLMPLRLMKLLLHAYQARIWNRSAEEYARYSKDNTVIPVVGHKTRLDNYPRVSGIVEEILEKEKIDCKDFRNSRFKELSSRGTERDFIVVPRNLTWEFNDDEESKGKLRLVLRFFLPKGSYATELVKQAMPQ